MALVDYTSDSSSSSTDNSSPPKKRPRVVPSSPPAPAPAATSAPELKPKPQPPPLPPAFHDLYASTVRTTTSDDPALHQGRTRQVPHVAGNWPSHVYVTWNPPTGVQTLLTSLLSTLQSKVPPSVEINTFLTSDLGAPLPLHISLSRPLSLTTASKDAFLSDLAASIRNCRIAPFTLSCRGVEWHHTDESGRSFLVLRVQSQTCTTSSDSSALNPELAALLRRCNAVADQHEQPQLYQWALKDKDSDGHHDDDRVGHAFHVSIAWSFTKPDGELAHLTDEVFGELKAQSSMRAAEIHVDGIKAKIGNVVTHIPLHQAGKRSNAKSSESLFGT